MTETLTLAHIQNARQRIAPCVRRTPLTASAALSERLKTNVYVKLELFQKTGSFKVRGAFNKALGLSAEERGQGLVAVSGGNHAQAVAYAARTLGLKSVILMPESTPANYVDATRGYGAEIKFAANVGAAFAEVAEYERQGWAYIHPFDDPVVMAGQGTIGLEILDDVPQVTDIIVSMGGGGLIGGIATAVRSLKPTVRVWGVETEGADCMSKSLAAGQIVTLEAITSIARTLGAPAPSEMTLAMAQRLARKRHRCVRRRSPGGAALSAGAFEGADRTRRLLHAGGGRSPEGSVLQGAPRGAGVVRRQHAVRGSSPAAGCPSPIARIRPGSAPGPQTCRA